MAVVAGGAAGARAEPAGEVVGVLRIDASGVSDKLEQGVIDGLTGAGVRVMDRASIAKVLVGSAGYVDGCTFGPCLRAVHDATGLRTVLVARIEGVGRTYDFVVSLVDTSSGRLVAQVAQSCAVCTVEDAITTATLSAVELVMRGDDTALRAPPIAAAPAVPDTAARDRRNDGARRALRRSGWLTLAVGVGAVIGGVVLAERDEGWGAGIAGGGAGLAAGGGLMILHAGRFELD